MGRHKQAGKREPNGRLQRASTLDQIKEADRAANIIEMVQVASQPHRRGSFDKWEGSAIGRFVKGQRLRSEIYDAAQEYSDLVAAWMAAKGIPTAVRRGIGTGDGPSSETVQSWAMQIARIEHTIINAGNPKMMHSGFLAMRRIVIFEEDIPSGLWPDAVAALCELARVMGRLPAGGHPFVHMN